jgi:uncharacterized membrane protein YhaH (DUF805 family)
LGIVSFLGGMPMNFGHILFSFNGRINRAKWWLAVLIMFIVNIVMYFLPSDGIMALVGFIIALVLLWISLAAGAKRLHDLDRTAAWLVVFIGVPILLILILIAYIVITAGAAVLTEQTLDASLWAQLGGAALIFLVLYLAVFIWALIWLGCLAGTPGPNRFGPDPLEPSGYAPAPR